MSSSPEWRQVRIRDVTLKTRTWNPSTEPRETVRYVDVSAVSRETLEIVGATELPAATAPSRARKIIKSEDTIFATIRPGLKRVAQVPASYDDELASTAFCVLRPDRALIDPDFLYFVASGDAFVEEVAGFETGASYPAVRDNDILDREILLPPLSHQRQIASALHAARAAMLHQVISFAIAEELKRAAMRELFTRGLRCEAQKETAIGLIPKNWEIVRVEDCASVISKGASPRWQGFDYVDNGVLFVRSQNVGDGFMLWDDKAFLSPEWNEKEKRSVLQKGDVLINLVGASIGRCAVGGPEIEGANCNQAVCFVRLNQGEVLPKFLSCFLLTSEGQRQIHGNKKDIARANLSLQDVRQILMPKPSIEAQREMVELLNALDRKIDLHKRKRAALQELFRALSHKLMTGQIHIVDLDLSALGQIPVTGAAA